MENIERKTHFDIYIVAILVTILFFVLGIVFGRYIAYEKAENLEISQKAISALFDMAVIKGELYGNLSVDYCNLGWDEIWKEKVSMGEILTNLEERLGKNNDEVIAQKKLYQEVQLKTFEIVKKVNEECDYTWDIILFFYINKKGDGKGDYRLSETQGYILDSVSERHKENVKVFSLDMNIDDEATKEIIDEYDITKAPSLVINRKLYDRIMSKYEIEQIIKR